jgi:pimeloyl-ACP methyl ester carboxylesterase
MSNIKKFYCEGPFGQLHGRLCTPSIATRRPLVLLHQSPKSGLELEPLMRACAHDRAVLAPDHPGYGMSDPPPREEEATIGAYACAAWAGADACGLGKVDLFGNHTGGLVAFEMAHTAPERVGAIVTVSAPIMMEEERQSFLEYFKPIPLDEAGTRFTTMWARIRQHAAHGVNLEGMARSLLQNMMGGERYEWGHAAAFNWAPELDRILPLLHHPITIINPADELQHHTRRAAHLMQSGVIIEKPNWGHGFLELFPQDVADIVRQASDTAGGPSTQELHQ